MGNDTINQATDGTPIPAANHNSIRGALSVDHVPRNSSGVVTDQAGSVGSTTYTWLKSYIRKMFVGAPTSLNSIEEDGSNDIIVKRNNIEVGKFTSDGFNRLALSTINRVASSDTGYYVVQTTSTDITNASVTITTNGNPVNIRFIPSAEEHGGGYCEVGGGAYASLTNPSLRITAYRDSTIILNQQLVTSFSLPIGAAETRYIPYILDIEDSPSAGIHTYKLQAYRNSDVNLFAYIRNYKLVVYEIV